MTSKTRSFRPSPALVLSCVALFLALTGSAFAVGVAKNSVRSKHIANGTVSTVDLRRNAVKPAKLAPDAVRERHLAKDSVGSDQVIDEALTDQDLGPDAVGESEIQPDAVGESEIQANAVGAAEIQANAVDSSELAPAAVRAGDLAPLVTASNNAPIKAGGNASVTVSCPAGRTAISGGSHGSKYQIHVTSLYRKGNGWHLDARNTGGEDGTITVYAYCLD